MTHTVGVGIDLVEVERLREALSRRPQLATRLFASSEIADARGKIEALAARFAAKEATMKALGVGMGAVGFAEIITSRLEGGAPAVTLVGRAHRRAQLLSVSELKVSLTHTHVTAGAIVVALRDA